MTPPVRFPHVLNLILERLQTDASMHFGCSSVSFVPDGFQDRPFSHVLRVGVCLGGNLRPDMHVFVKSLKPKPIPGGLEAMRQRVARDFEATQRAHAALASHPDLGAVRPVACYPELLAIVTEQVTGPTLLDYLDAEISWWPSASSVASARATMARVGRWIRAFQDANAPGSPTSIQGLRDYIDIRLERLVSHAGPRFTADDRVSVLRHIDRLGATVRPEELRQVAAHCDMSLGNVLVSDGRIVVLDFAMTGFETRLNDLTKVFLQIDLLRAKPQYRTRVVRALQVSLLEGFDPCQRTDAPLFRLSMLLHRVNHLTGLYVNRRSMRAAMYNRRVRGDHHRSLRRELDEAIPDPQHA